MQAGRNPLLRSRFPDECIDLALGGGEDYVLLFTGQAAKINHVVSGLPGGAAVVGEIVGNEGGEAGRVTVMDADGQERPSPNRGWDHFSSAKD